LVELHIEVIRGDTRVAWDVVTGIDNTGDTEAKKRVDGKLNILEIGVVASSGNSSVSLRTEEEGSGEKERSLLTTVTTEETLEGSALLEGTIGVVDPTMLENITISGHVGVVHGHANLGVILSGFENRWLVHVVPDTVHVVGSLEDGGVEEILPVVTGAVVEEINPDGRAGAALTLVRLLGGGVSHEEVGDVVLVNVLALLLEAFLVHEVVGGGAEMGVGSDNEATARVVDLTVHVHDIILREALVVVLTVLVVLGVLAVEPEDIDGETELGEVVVSLDDLMGRVLLPLGEVVTERVHGRHWGVTSELREFLLKLLGVALGAHEVELESVALRDESGVGLLTKMSVVQEDEGLSGVHPGDGGIHSVRVTSDVGDGSVKGLAVLASFFGDVSVLVEKAVRVIETCLLEAEVVVPLGDTVHVGGVDGEVHTNRVALDDGRGRLGGLLLLSCLLLSSIGGGTVVHTQVLGVVVEVIVVVDNDGLVSVNVLDDSEGIELDLVRDLVLSADEDTVVEDLDEVLHVLLNLDLIPIDTDSGVRDGEALFFIGGLDLDLHDTVLEESHVEVEMGGTEFHGVLGEVLVLVELKGGVDSILVDNQGIGLNEVSSHQVVGLHVVLVVLGAAVVVFVAGSAARELGMVASKQLAEAVTVVLDSARFSVLLAELFSAMLVLVRDVLGALGVVVVGVGIISVMDGLLVVGLTDMLGDVMAASVVSVAAVVSLFVLHGLKLHTVVSEGVTSCGSCETKHTSGKNGGSEVHSTILSVKSIYYY